MFTADQLAALLYASGLVLVEDLGIADLGPRFFGTPPRAGSSGGHLVHARVAG